MFCRKCGSEIDDNCKACPICGEVIAQITSEEEIKDNTNKRLNFKVAIPCVIVAYILRFVTNLMFYSLPRIILIPWIIIVSIALAVIAYIFYKRYKVTKSIPMLILSILEAIPVISFILALISIF